MATQFDQIQPRHEEFILRQRIFFVGSAPVAGGHVNVSPKGYDSLRVLSPTEIAYLDLTGSGNETSGHIRENGRITLMFCAFEGPPLILRIYGTGSVLLAGTKDFDGLASHFPSHPGARQIIRIRGDKVQTSCGYGVPLLEYSGDRDTLHRWTEKKGEGIEEYRREQNSVTIDGLLTPIGERLATPEA